jgi:hypothetical protein
MNIDGAVSIAGLAQDEVHPVASQHSTYSSQERLWLHVQARGASSTINEAELEASIEYSARKQQDLVAVTAIRCKGVREGSQHAK